MKKITEIMYLCLTLRKNSSIFKIYGKTVQKRGEVEC